MEQVTDPVLQVRRLGLDGDPIDYSAGWQLQRDLHAQVVAGDHPPVALLLEHQPVFTAGRRTEPQDRPANGSPVIEVDRGGKITWHGPGQLVCYPIVPLPQPFDVVAHVRRLEEIVIRVCADQGLSTERIPGRSGVWRRSQTAGTVATNPEPGRSRPSTASPGRSPDRKIAAVGVRVAKGVTMHGIALNVDCDLNWAQQIIPCGISDAAVTSIAIERSDTIEVADVVDGFEARLREVLEPALPRLRRA